MAILSQDLQLVHDALPSRASGANATTVQFPRVPIELFRQILYHVAYESNPRIGITCKLSFVCRFWRREVEQIMYSRPKVPPRKIVFFSRTIVSRPDLAPLVVSLDFTVAGNRGKNHLEDTELVARMLRMLVNLKHLNIREGDCLPMDSTVRNIDYWVLDDVPFLLESYSCHFCWEKPLLDFLAKQRNLREFVHGGGVRPEAIDVPEVDDETLANCGTLKVPPDWLWGLRGPRKDVTHLLVKMWYMEAGEVYHAAEAIQLIGETLVSLGIHKLTDLGAETYPSVSTMVRRFAEGTPHLRFLALYDDMDFSSKDNQRLMQVISQHLHKLAVLIWAPLYDAKTHDDDDDDTDVTDFSVYSDDDTPSPNKIERYANNMFQACKSLQIFISIREQKGLIWRRDEKTNKAKVALKDCFAGLQEEIYKHINPDDPLDCFMTPNVQERSNLWRW